MKYSKTKTKTIAAAKAGMSLKTARKYLANPQLNAEDTLSPRQWRTRTNPFEAHWTTIISFLEDAPGLEAKTIMQWLIENYPDKYNMSQLRTLQRHFH